MMQKKTFKCDGTVCILSDKLVSISINFSDNDIETMKKVFGDKSIREDKSCYFLKVVQTVNGEDVDGCGAFVENATVFFSQMLELEASEESPAVRLSKVQFFGQCRNCGEIVNITKDLTMERRKELYLKFGAEMKENNWVCTYVREMDFCPKCAHVDV